MQGTASAPVSRHGSHEDLTALQGTLNGTQASPAVLSNDFAAKPPTSGIPADPVPQQQHDIIHTSSAPQALFRSDGPDQRPVLSTLETTAPQSRHANGRPTTAPSADTPKINVDGDYVNTAIDTRPMARRRHSGHSHKHYEPYSAGGYSGYSLYGRPLDHKSARHSTPLYSLARPLPTFEQRQAQKGYRDQVRAKAATETAFGHDEHSHTHRHHHGHSGRNTPHNLGPGALHHGGVAAGPALYGPYGRDILTDTRSSTPHMRSARSVGSFTNNQSDKEQLMVMLRQILQETQQSGHVVSKLASGGDVREDDTGDKDGKEIGPAGEKQNEKGDVARNRTSRAERRDSVTSSSSSYSSDSDDVEEFPNPIARMRHVLREPLAEFIGTFLLIIFGTDDLQYFLTLNPAITSTPFGTYTNVSLGWGVGVAMGVWTAGGISGGHINPAVTISLALFRGFPWKKVPGYILAQILGSMTAAGINYIIYRGAISIYEGGASIRTVSGPTATASLFSTYPQTYVSNATAFFQEFLNSAILLIVVLAISDANNASPPDGLNPLVLFLLILGLGACLGMQTAYCVNPARDLGPRLVTWFAGYGREVWDFRSQYWLWVPICATISGALFGSFVYDLLIYTGAESPLNRKWSWPWSKKARSSFAPASKNKLPAGQNEP